MVNKDTGLIAFEARHETRAPTFPWSGLSESGRNDWRRVYEACVGHFTQPQPGWREMGQDDPHGTQYLCERERIAGGHLADDQVAFQVSMLERTAAVFEGVLAAGRDRIRWLARQLESTKEALRAAAREQDRLREQLGLRASRIKSLEQDLAASVYRRLKPGEIPELERFLIWTPNRPRQPDLIARSVFASARAGGSVRFSLSEYTHWAPVPLPSPSTDSRNASEPAS